MKRLVLLAAFLLTTVPVFALDTRSPRKPINVIDDVIRMTQAGVGDAAIISYVVHFRGDFAVTADDVIAMTNAHVSADVVKTVVDEAAAREEDRGRQKVVTDPADSEPYFYPFWPFYDYDPWWFMPRYYNAGGRSLSIPKEATHEATRNPDRRSVPVTRGAARPRAR